MALNISYDLKTPDLFWSELDDILATACPSFADIDNVLRSYLALATTFRETYLSSDEDLARLALSLRRSTIFQKNTEYIRRQFVYCLLQEDEPSTLYVVAALLLFDGRASEESFEMMQQEDVFPRLVELIQERSNGKDASLNRLLLMVVYEMARIQRLAWSDLASVNDSFILCLFAIIESVSNDVSDPYHYPVIRVLLVLNEQYMVAAASQSPNSTSPLTNRVLKAISTHASTYKTFGENLILLLNRESETSLQLLILKLLYLVFGTPSTAEYFYTNDLHVLLDVILRNLLDLPADAGDGGAMQALRHTYLRVLHPLMENSQLRRPRMAYKREEILEMLQILGGGTSGSQFHFAPVDETTKRLVDRCRKVAWLAADGNLQPAPVPATVGLHVGNGHVEVARRTLGMSVEEGGKSSLSVMEVARHTEKPGVVTPSRGLANGMY